MLKSLGLWKSLYEDDSNYPHENDFFEIVEDNSDDEVYLNSAHIYVHISTECAVA